MTGYGVAVAVLAAYGHRIRPVAVFVAYGIATLSVSPGGLGMMEGVVIYRFRHSERRRGIGRGPLAAVRVLGADPDRRAELALPAPATLAGRPGTAGPRPRHQSTGITGADR